MLHALVGGGYHGHGNGDTVIGTQCRLVGREPAIIGVNEFNGVIVKIMAETLGFLADHVHMALQNQGL